MSERDDRELDVERVLRVWPADEPQAGFAGRATAAARERSGAGTRPTLIGAAVLAAALGVGAFILRGAPAPEPAPRSVHAARQGEPPAAEPTGPPASIEDEDEEAPPDGGSPTHGSLDKEIIARVVARHLHEVKACYDPELEAKPGLEGSIMVQFTIGAEGLVVASELVNSTMKDAVVEGCVVEAVRHWEFPKPVGGGVVVVSYPFLFKRE